MDIFSCRSLPSMARKPAASGGAVRGGGMSEPSRKAEMLFETSTVAEIREVGASGDMDT